MSNTDRDMAAGNWIAPGAAVAAAVLRQAESWASAQGELLFEIEAAWTGWMKRQSQAIEAGSRSLQRMCDCRNPAELLQMQQQLVQDMLRRTASDFGGLASDTLAAAARPGNADRVRADAGSPTSARRAAPQPNEATPVQRAAE